MREGSTDPTASKATATPSYRGPGADSVWNFGRGAEWIWIVLSRCRRAAAFPGWAGVVTTDTSGVLLAECSCCVMCSPVLPTRVSILKQSFPMVSVGVPKATLRLSSLEGLTEFRKAVVPTETLSPFHTDAPPPRPTPYFLSL